MSHLRSARSTEAPMDWDYTSRKSVEPVWARKDDPATPKKRPLTDANWQPPPLQPPSSPMFGANRNVPFIFNATPSTPAPPVHPWAPPPNFSPTKPIFEPEVHDVDMSEATPPQAEEKRGRSVAAGALRRVYKSRTKARAEKQRSQGVTEEDASDSEDEDENKRVAPIRQSTSNHYTLHMPSPPVPQSDLPYILSGYLQFFFNLALILLFLYLVVQFIITVQRDVQERISEYSMDIVQEIAMCATQYRTNCGTHTVPAMSHQCGVWESCMNRDPSIVGRAKVGAELIAEVVNGFVEPISWKTLTFTLTSLSFLTVFINTLFSIYRSRHQPGTAAPPLHPSYSMPPPTPYQHFGNYMPPATPTPAWGKSWSDPNVDGMQSPTRRRRIEGGGSLKIN
ncbi:hypothetical protein BDN71DRAFT_1418857 [Pleurotus eryngii]|uniref:Brl1/Brr6 domain-containing protein n=1 Tax=Pleurotus eryngii TaxID=5323 RepID=A0A9P6DF17_PLEER|nr:hypothetical protein BDN71DRAFT_1418857 [Pleurotus eryngii]